MTELVKVGGAVLSKVAVNVPSGQDVSDLIQVMRDCLALEKGAGLAANQIGWLERVILINVADYVGAIINPVITKRSGKLVNSTEGCLSFPGRKVIVKRDKMVTIEGFDENWQPIKKKLRGFSAFCAQHEIDHLNGITILPNQGKGE